MIIALLSAVAALSWVVAFVSISAALGFRDEAREYKQIFAMKLKADLRGIKMWQDSTGRHDTWPDRSDHMKWCIEQLEAARAELAALKPKASPEPYP